MQDRTKKFWTSTKPAILLFCLWLTITIIYYIFANQDRHYLHGYTCSTEIFTQISRNCFYILLVYLCFNFVLLIVKAMQRKWLQLFSLLLNSLAIAYIVPLAIFIALFIRSPEETLRGLNDRVEKEYNLLEIRQWLEENGHEIKYDDSITEKFPFNYTGIENLELIVIVEEQGHLYLQLRWPEMAETNWGVIIADSPEVTDFSPILGRYHNVTTRESTDGKIFFYGE